MPSQPSANKTLVLFTDSTYFSGAEKAFGVLGQELLKGGHTVSLQVTPAAHERFTALIPSAQATAVRSKFALTFLLKTCRSLTSEKPDAVVVNMWSPYANTLFLIAAKVCKVPAITIYHYYQERDMVTGLLRPLKLWAYRFGERLASRVLTVSEAHRHVLIDQFRFPATKVGVLPNSVPSPSPSPSFTDHSPRKFLAVGSLEPAKGYRFLIEQLIHITEPWELTVLGDGPSRPDLEEAATPGANHITFAGKQTNVDTYYRSHDVLVHPSHFENLSLAIIEAMSYGLAIIANDVGGNSELVEQGKNGWLLTLEDSAAWQQALTQACTSDLMPLRKASEEMWQARFTQGEQYRVFSEELEQLLP